MRLRLLGVLVLAATVLPAGDAAAQEACTAPSIEAFLVTPGHFPRSGEAEEVLVRTRGATAVNLAWPDGTSSSAVLREDLAVVRHVFRGTGGRRVVATATGPCGPPASGALTMQVRPPCARDRGRSVYAPECDYERGVVRVRQAGLSTGSTWLNFPCNDVLFPPVPVAPEPVARAASCVANTDPPQVPGLLPVRSDSVLRLTLGVPARAVRLALGGPSRPGTRFKRASRAGASGRFWRIRLATVRTSTRLWIRVRHGLGDDAFVAGLDPRG